MDIAAAVILPLDNPPALRYVTLQMTRDGEQTAPLKVTRFLNREMQTEAVFAGSYSVTQRFLASAVDMGWLVVGVDETPAARAAARFIQIDSDITIALDLNDGSGGGGGGAPATVAAITRVDRLPAQREVVVLDRAVDGAWRVAGSGLTNEAGSVQLDLRVTPSSRVYAMAADDYGLPYQAGLPVAVGSRVRPSVYTGWLYEVTQAGTLPSTEPTWWAASDVNPPRLIGTAWLMAVRYYRPLAHGPVPVELL